MRELVYVSEAKLRQLLPDLPKRARGLRDVEAEVTTPVGGLKVGKAAREAEPGLAGAVARLEASERAPKWFADPDVRPGQWVHFEAPMSYGVVVSAATFLDVGEPVDGYPSGGQLRLLLHGSSAHLLGAGHPEHRTGRDVTFSLWLHFTHALREANVENGRSDLDDNQLFHGWLKRVLRWLDQEFQPRYTAAWVAGYARVTARIPTPSGTVLAATPLYVEHVEPPA
ncbi:SAVMC3_10250 family protein [Amycolatopsis sp. ATCC 39116]|uniref:SAVMC3_10250 family protein n=1 Tax=Amycolatopsis sp. (strain ATCC 39116 / 75iv2) TaxID=385957 RepID=UPI0002626E06|nr:SAVMC3_10250 family protein [Amycolatopsis sp. ATCC 39116]